MPLKEHLEIFGADRGSSHGGGGTQGHLHVTWLCSCTSSSIQGHRERHPLGHAPAICALLHRDPRCDSASLCCASVSGSTAPAPLGARLTHPHMLGRHARASEPGVLQFSLLFFFSVESSRNGLNLIAGPVCVRQWDESQWTRSLASSPLLAAAGLPPGQCSWPQGNWVALGHVALVAQLTPLSEVVPAVQCFGRQEVSRVDGPSGINTEKEAAPSFPIPDESFRRYGRQSNGPAVTATSDFRSPGRCHITRHRA